MLHIFVDADACPVKQEIYRVADRYKLSVTLVAGSRMRIPDHARVNLKVVDQGLDAADDWIVEHLEADDIVITGDVPLAARCVRKGAYVLGHHREGIHRGQHRPRAGNPRFALRVARAR